MNQGALVFDGPKNAFFNHPDLLNWKLEKPDQMHLIDWTKKISQTTNDEPLKNALLEYLKKEASYE
jgi:hypothetical protein